MRRAIWITGVPSSGKSALGTRLVTTMKRELGAPCGLLDANVIREQFWPHIGLSPEDRAINVRGMAELGGVFIRAGSDVVIACIAPDRQVRNRALGLLRVSAQNVAVYQVHVMAPLEVLKARDDKGLYRAAEEGRLIGLTGVEAPYEPPGPEEALYLDTSQLSLDEATRKVLEYVVHAQVQQWPATMSSRPAPQRHRVALQGARSGDRSVAAPAG
jgi:adenylylsulfate kinase-like enzyme